MHIEKLLIHIPSYLLALPLLIGLIRWKGHSHEQRRLNILLICWAILQIGQHLGMLLFRNNLPLFHLALPIEFPLIVAIYRPGFKKEAWSPLLLPITLVFICFCILSAIFWQGLDQLPTTTRTVESFLLSLLALAYFFTLLRDLRITHLLRSPMFWLSTGTLIYYAGNVLIFFFANFILQGAVRIQTWAIHSTLLVLLYITYSISLLCKGNPSISSKAS